MGDCKTNSCNTSNQSCNTSNQSCAQESSCCPTQASSECPIENSIAHWKESYQQAIHEVAVDILKEKIRKAWGPMMEKSADAIIQAGTNCWETSLSKAKAQVELKEQFKKIFQETGKK